MEQAVQAIHRQRLQAAVAALRCEDTGATMTTIDDLASAGLDDNTYDVVICADVIASIPEENYRLFLSELARLCRRSGTVVMSTELDIDTQDAAQRFLSLLSTEFNDMELELTHNALFIKALRILNKISSRLQKRVAASEGIRRFLEMICLTLSGDDGISHIIVTAKKREIMQEMNEEKKCRRLSQGMELVP